MKIYGIKNCSSVKKALDYFEAKKLEYEFCDIKKLDEATLNSWLKQKSFAMLINTAGTTAKKLALNKEKIATLQEAELKKLVLEYPSLIKRPFIDKDGQYFIAKEYEKL